MVRAQREHALVRRRAAAGSPTRALQHVAGGHQRRDLDVLVLRAVGLAQLRVGERARILVGRRELREHGERGRVLGHERERGLDRRARAGAIVEPLDAQLREPDVERRASSPFATPSASRRAAAMRDPRGSPAASRSRPALASAVTSASASAGSSGAIVRAWCSAAAASSGEPSQSISTCARRASSWARSCGSRASAARRRSTSASSVHRACAW